MRHEYFLGTATPTYKIRFDRLRSLTETTSAFRLMPYALCLQSTSKIKHFKYSVSGTPIRTGWSNP
jgi:hypothetical protein